MRITVRAQGRAPLSPSATTALREALPGLIPVVTALSAAYIPSRKPCWVGGVAERRGTVKQWQDAISLLAAWRESGRGASSRCRGAEAG